MSIILDYQSLEVFSELAINNCPGHLPEIKACLQFLYKTGSRVQESFDVSRWNMSGATTWILTPTKESNQRSFQKSQLPVQWKNFMQEQNRMSTYVNYRKINYYMNQSIGHYNITTGEKNILTHIYRHTYVQMMKYFEFQPVQIQQQLGHKELSSTMLYYDAVITADSLPQ